MSEGMSLAMILSKMVGAPGLQGAGFASKHTCPIQGPQFYRQTLLPLFLPEQLSVSNATAVDAAAAVAQGTEAIL